MTSTHFRFLDLPRELRFLVYEHLDTTIRRVQALEISSTTKGEIEFLYPSFASSILSTCKLINAEAEPFFARAYKYGTLETTHSFQLGGTGDRDIMKCLTAAQLLMVGLHQTPIPDNREIIRQPFRDFDPVTRRTVGPAMLHFAKRATQIHVKFGRTLRINVNWSVVPRAACLGDMYWYGTYHARAARYRAMVMKTWSYPRYRDVFEVVLNIEPEQEATAMGY